MHKLLLDCTTHHQFLHRWKSKYSFLFIDECFSFLFIRVWQWWVVYYIQTGSCTTPLYPNLFHEARMVQNLIRGSVWRGDTASLLSCLFGAKENWPGTLYMPHLFSYKLTMYKQPYMLYIEHNHENAPSMSLIDRFNQAKLSDNNALHNHNKPLQAA